MVELGHDAGQVADAVAVRVGVGAGVDLVKDAAVPPTVGVTLRIGWRHGHPFGSSWRSPGERSDLPPTAPSAGAQSRLAAAAMICRSTAMENGAPTDVKVTW